jgi:hypothetical protein
MNGDSWIITKTVLQVSKKPGKTSLRYNGQEQSQDFAIGLRKFSTSLLKDFRYLLNSIATA